MSPRFFDGMLGSVGGAFDRAMVNLALDLAKDPRRENDGAARVAALEAVTEAYSDPKNFSDGGFFIEPEVFSPKSLHVRSLPGGGAVSDLEALSGFVPVRSEYREKYLGYKKNTLTYGRLWAHETPRATVVCVHGYLGGALGFEELAFDARRLYSAGLDVFFIVLPFHGERTPEGMRGCFPGRDPWRTVEGFAQAVHDLRGWRSWLRGRGSQRVGLFGMSLGGYTAALAATVDNGWDFVVPMIPLASLADAYMHHRAGRPEAPPPSIRPKIEDAYRVVSPFARTPKVVSERALVLAATGDNITPVSHAERVARHFGARVEMFAGGHLLQLGRARAFEVMMQFFENIMVIPPL